MNNFAQSAKLFKEIFVPLRITIMRNKKSQ